MKGYDKIIVGLGFAVTKSMLWIVAFVGGFFLILIQIILTKITMIITITRSLHYSAIKKYILH